MKEITLIQACSALGVHVEGAQEGPGALLRALAKHGTPQVQAVFSRPTDSLVAKGTDIEAVNEFNTRLYNVVLKTLEDGCFPLTIGGDHSITIASVLASQRFHGNLGLLWVDSHGDYNDFDTTITGNLHGMPFAAVTGFHCQRLTPFFSGPYIDPRHCVLLGARDLDFPQEWNNLEKAGVTVIPHEEIARDGIQRALEKAWRIVLDGTNGVHVSFDLDVIDPLIAPGVSIPVPDGLDLDAVEQIIAAVQQMEDRVKSMDLVEFNPHYDVGQRTQETAVRILSRMLGWSDAQIGGQG